MPVIIDRFLDALGEMFPPQPGHDLFDLNDRDRPAPRGIGWDCVGGGASSLIPLFVRARAAAKGGAR
jgi:hypothetical protein